MKNWLILQKDITTLTVHASNKRVSKYMRQKQTELQGEIEKVTITVDTSTSLFV